MTDKKITELTAYTAPVNADVLPIVDTSTNTTKKISWATIKSALDFTTADIVDSTDKRYCTDAQKVVIGNTSGTNTGDETAERIGTLTNGSAAKDTLVDADNFAATNSASSHVLVKHTWAKLKTGITTLFKAFASASVSMVTGYTSDTYLAGSAITIPAAGGWQVGTQYRLIFDIVKTASGTQAFTIKIRLGTTGTKSDTAVLTLSFAVGTADIDTGRFEVLVTFRTVGSGASAVIQGVATCVHHLAATGLITTGASGTGIIIGTSSGFDSSLSTTIGVSINGGTSFFGTCTLVQAELLGLFV